MVILFFPFGFDMREKKLDVETQAMHRRMRIAKYIFAFYLCFKTSLNKKALFLFYAKV